MYLRALVVISSFSKSLRRLRKIFLGFSPVFSAISWRVSSVWAFFNADRTCWSVLFNFTIEGSELLVAEP